MSVIATGRRRASVNTTIAMSIMTEVSVSRCEGPKVYRRVNQSAGRVLGSGAKWKTGHRGCDS